MFQNEISSWGGMMKHPTSFLSFFFCRKKKETKKTHHESQLQIFFSHKPSHFLAEKFAVRSFRGRQPHALRL
jgi:hypothetical protein